jgi:hypothetical protein
MLGYHLANHRENSSQDIENANYNDDDVVADEKLCNNCFAKAIVQIVFIKSLA